MTEYQMKDLHATNHKVGNALSWDDQNNGQRDTQKVISRSSSNQMRWRYQLNNSSSAVIRLN